MRLIPFTFVILLLSSIAFAQITVEGGNVTELNVSGRLNATYWDGLYGEIVLGTGANYSHLVNGNNVVDINMVAQDPNCTIAAILIHVIAVNDTSLTTPLSIGNLPQLDALIPFSRESGSGTFTLLSAFDLTYGLFNNVPTTYTFADNTSSLDFREGYLNDAAGNLVFVTEVVDNQPDWQGGTSDYQIMLPRGVSPMNYTLLIDVNYTCTNVTPGPGPSPGGNKHTLYVDPPGTYSVGAGEIFDFDVLIENRGDFVERDIDVYIQSCPPGFSCGSDLIGRIGVGDQEQADFPITVNGAGEYVLTVCAENDDVIDCSDFIVRVTAECSSDSDCAEDEYCDNGVCEPKKKPKEECERNGECESGLCSNGICILCESDNDCESDEVCSTGLCEKIECACGYISNHECIEYECCSDSDCSDDEYCISHECVEKELDIIVIEGEYIEGEDILVQVVDNRGQPVPFATVFTDYMSVVADENGYAKIKAPYNGLLYANKDGYPQAGMLLGVIKLGIFVADEEIYAGQETRIRLVDSQGLPIAGAEVYFNGYSYVTDENGYFLHTFDSPGKRTLAGEKQGYLINPLEISVAGEVLCGFPIILNFWWFDYAGIYVLWLVSILLALLNLGLTFRRFTERKMKKALKGGIYSLLPLVLALPGVNIFNICFMSNVIVLQTVIEIMILIRDAVLGEENKERKRNKKNKK
ncbi:hypothetical protein GF374_03345 [Candidatus Woesearchaeota archaeon]|nr:hypothetical protein [Candidatus Woesearchaeota archaeon]